MFSSYMSSARAKKFVCAHYTKLLFLNEATMVLLRTTKWKILCSKFVFFVCEKSVCFIQSYLNNAFETCKPDSCSSATRTQRTEYNLVLSGFSELNGISDSCQTTWTLGTAPILDSSLAKLPLMSCWFHHSPCSSLLMGQEATGVVCTYDETYA